MNFDDLEVFVWEGSAEVFDRVQLCLSAFDLPVTRADGLALGSLTQMRQSIAVISVSVLESMQFSRQSIEGRYGMPVIWVGAQGRERETKNGSFAQEYAHVLPLDFTGAELRSMLVRVVQKIRSVQVAPVSKSEFIAISPTMLQLLEEVDTFANCEHSVMLYGETGSGKERIAQRLRDGNTHYGKGPFVVVNCGAIPDGLFESLFFGHAKGAFTGAVAAHKGYFEQANGGTLFLDEIGDLPRYQQVKLLRVLEEGAVTRVGASSATKLDFRLIAATNRPLRAMVNADDFRADLFFRLSVIELYVPSLEERGPDDKEAIFKAMLHQVLGPDVLREIGDTPLWILQAISQMRFSGNVRELRNVAERVGIIARQTRSWSVEALIQRLQAQQAMMSGDEGDDSTEEEIPRNWNTDERRKIIDALELNAWKRLSTAQYLGMSRKALWEKMRKYRIVDAESETA